MDKIKITNDMKNLLSSIKGETFLSYECEIEDKWNRTYGYLRINTDLKSLDISNQQKSMSLFGENEDVAIIEIFGNKNKSMKESFNLIDTFSPKKVEINEVIKDVFIISEIVELNDEKIEMDMGIIIQTDKHKYYFTKENWFDEFIYINVDKDFDTIYPIEKDKDEWSSDESDDIKISRFIDEI